MTVTTRENGDCSAPVVFDSGCVAGRNVVGCTSGGLKIRSRSRCEVCGCVDERCVQHHPNSPFWGVDVLFECGVLLQDGSEVFPERRSSRRGTFVNVWAAACPEGSQPIVDDELCWLTGVRLPDGSTIMRDGSEVER